MDTHYDDLTSKLRVQALVRIAERAVEEHEEVGLTTGVDGKKKLVTVGISNNATTTSLLCAWSTIYL